MSSAALSEYRNIVRLLFRVVDPDHYKSKDLDALLDRIHDILQTSDSVRPVSMIPLSFMEEAIRPPTPPTLIIHPDQKVEDIVPTVIVTKSEPEMKTVRVQENSLTPTKPQNIVVTPPFRLEVGSSKADAAIFRTLAENTDSDSDSFVEPDLNSDSDTESQLDLDESEAESEAESDAEEEEEAEESEAEEEEEYDEERDGEMEIMKIKKERYWITSKNQKVFEYTDGAYGDCIGVFKDGKIVSSN